MNNSTKFRDVIAKMMEAITLDAKGDMKILDETAMAEADALLNDMIVEKAQNWWDQLESAEASLAGMADEIGFSELNADPSHVASPALNVDAGNQSDPAMDAGGDSLEGMLEGEEFDLDTIFEGYDDEEEVDEGYHMEDDEEFGPGDGDEEFDDLMTGNDEAGIGDDSSTDGDVGDDLDMIGGDDDLDIGGDDDLEADGDFDFSFLDDGTEDGPLDDDMGEMNHLDHVQESDDDDKDSKDDEKDDDDSDEKDDDEDDDKEKDED